MFRSVSIQLKLMLGFFFLLLVLAIALHGTHQHRLSAFTETIQADAFDHKRHSIHSELQAGNLLAVSILETITQILSTEKVWTPEETQARQQTIFRIEKNLRKTHSNLQLTLMPLEAENLKTVPAETVSGFAYQANTLSNKAATTLYSDAIPVAQLTLTIPVSTMAIAAIAQRFDVDIKIQPGPEGETATALKGLTGESVAVFNFTPTDTIQFNPATEAVSDTVLITGVLLLLGLGFALILARGIQKPLGADPAEVKALAQQLAAGNLDIPDTNASADSVYASFHSVVTQLRTTVNKVVKTSDAINQHAVKMNQHSTSLQQRAQNQARSLVASVEFMRELSSNVRKNADHTQSAGRLTKKVRDQVNRGHDVVEQVKSSLHHVSQSTDKASNVISAIDEIAFETNLLSLNAALEAARAGKGGNGFANVANEIRDLALKSGIAANEIKHLIEDGGKNSEIGSDGAHDAGDSMSKILEATNLLNKVLQDIAFATAKQSSGIGKMNDAICALDQDTAENSELALNASKAAKELAAEAKKLDKMMYFLQARTLDSQLERRLDQQFSFINGNIQAEPKSQSTLKPPTQPISD